MTSSETPREGDNLVDQDDAVDDRAASSSAAGGPIPEHCPVCSTKTRPAAQFCGECGHALVDGAVGALVPVATTPSGNVSSSSSSATASTGDRFGRLVEATVTWAVRRKFLVGGVAAVVVLAVAAGSYLWSQPGVGGGAPDAPVSAYFNALATRDGAAAAQLAGGSASGPLWAAGALSSGYTPPADVTVASISYGAAADETRREDHSYATVTVTYLLDGVLVEQAIAVSRDAGGLVRDWTITDGATGTLTVGAAAASWRAAGAQVTGESTPAPPGVYDVEVAGGPLFADVATTVAVTGGDAGSGGAPLALTLRPEATVEVQRQVDAFADACAAADDIDWSGCWWADDSGLVSVVEDAVWAITRYPVVQLAVDDGRVEVSGTPGEATGSYRNPLSDQEKEIHADIYVGGEVVVEGGAIVWRPGPPPEGMPSVLD